MHNEQQPLMSDNLVVFVLDNRYYAFDITYVQELCTFKNITRLPLAPWFVKGVYDREGDIIPVIGLRELFMIQALEGVSQGIVIRYQEHTIVIQVDVIVGIFPPRIIKKVERAINSFSKFQMNCTQSLVEISEKKLCYCIDVEEIVSQYVKVAQDLYQGHYYGNSLQRQVQ